MIKTAAQARSKRAAPNTFSMMYWRRYAFMIFTRDVIGAFTNRRTSTPLGKSLVVYDPVLRLPVGVFPCEDGHAQERCFIPKREVCNEENII